MVKLFEFVNNYVCYISLIRRNNYQIIVVIIQIISLLDKKESVNS